MERLAAFSMINQKHEKEHKGISLMCFIAKTISNYPVKADARGISRENRYKWYPQDSHII